MRYLACLALLVLAVQGPAFADSQGPGESTAHDKDVEDPAQLAVGVGWFDVAKRDDNAADFRLEYRSSLSYLRIRPWLGLEATSDGAIYGIAGILRDIDILERWVLTPVVGVGFYHDGGGKNLGSTLEFRVQGDLAYRFNDGSRLALSFSHISNARIGGNNPGSEIVSLYYLIPLDRLL